MENIDVTKDNHIFCTVMTAAFNLGIERQSLYLWLKKYEIPKKGKLVDFTEILTLRREKAEQKNDESNSAKKLAAEMKIKQEKAKQEAIKTAELEGKVIYLDQVSAALVELFTEIRTELLTIPENIQSEVILISPDIAGDCKEIAERIVTKSLLRLSEGRITGGEK